MEKENIHFGFEISTNNKIILYEKTGKYEDNIDFTNVEEAINHLNKIIGEVR